MGSTLKSRRELERGMGTRFEGESGIFGLDDWSGLFQPGF